MTDWHPQIVRIDKLEKHPNADTLDYISATSLGDYPVIAKSGQYKVGDLTCYLPIDTIVPDTEEFHFLSPRKSEKYTEDGEIKVRYFDEAKHPVGQVPAKYRTIKARRLRGIYSMGMLHPPIPDLNVGDSVVEALKLVKRPDEAEDDGLLDGSLGGAKRVRGTNAAKAPEGWSIPYYDIEGLRKYLLCLSPDDDVILTEKVHGANGSFCFDGEKLWAKSRNYYKKEDEGDDWWSVAKRLNLAEKLKKFPMLVFFGELIGRVKNFRYDCPVENGQLLATDMRFFDILDTKTMRYLDYADFIKIIDGLELKRTPELYRGKWMGKEKMYAYAEGNTMLGDKHVREGFVLRLEKERFEPKLGGRLQFKLVGEGFALAT